MRMLLAAFAALLLVGCGCPDRPDTYKGARLSGCTGDGSSVACCSYSGQNCSYTLCQVECGDWEQESWSCW